MSLIILVNGLVSLLIGGLFYYHVNENKDRLKRSKEIAYFLFGAHFVFCGFLRIKVSMSNGGLFNFNNFNVFNQVHLFTLLSLISHIAFAMFIFNSIKQEKKNVVNPS